MSALAIAALAACVLVNAVPGLSRDERRRLTGISARPLGAILPVFLAFASLNALAIVWCIRAVRAGGEPPAAITRPSRRPGPGAAS